MDASFYQYCLSKINLLLFYQHIAMIFEQSWLRKTGVNMSGHKTVRDKIDKTYSRNLLTIYDRWDWIISIITSHFNDRGNRIRPICVCPCVSVGKPYWWSMLVCVHVFSFDTALYGCVLCARVGSQPQKQLGITCSFHCYPLVPRW